MNTRLLFVLNGPAGGGKSSTLAFLRQSYGFGLVAKYTDRPPRQAELDCRSPGDSVCIPEHSLSLLLRREGFFSHMHGGYRYTFSEDQVERHLRQCAGAAVIVGSHRVIQEVREAFGSSAQVVTVYVDAEDDIIRARLDAANAPRAEIDYRMSRSAHIRRAFSRNPELYDHVINNNHGRAAFEAQLRAVVEHYAPQRSAVNAA